MDYQEFSGVTISEQDKAFAQEFAKLRERTDVFRREHRQGVDQSAPLPATADVQNVYRFYAPVGIQLSERNL